MGGVTFCNSVEFQFLFNTTLLRSGCNNQIEEPRFQITFLCAVDMTLMIRSRMRDSSFIRCIDITSCCGSYVVDNIYRCNTIFVPPVKTLNVFTYRNSRRNSGQKFHHVKIHEMFLPFLFPAPCFPHSATSFHNFLLFDLVRNEVHLNLFPRNSIYLSTTDVTDASRFGDDSDSSITSLFGAA